MQMHGECIQHFFLCHKCWSRIERPAISTLRQVASEIAASPTCFWWHILPLCDFLAHFILKRSPNAEQLIFPADSPSARRWLSDSLQNLPCVNHEKANCRALVQLFSFKKKLFKTQSSSLIQFQKVFSPIFLLNSPSPTEVPQYKTTFVPIGAVVPCHGPGEAIGAGRTMAGQRRRIRRDDQRLQDHLARPVPEGISHPRRFD